MIFLGLVLAHLIADFYFQTDSMVREKKKYMKRHLLHHLLAALVPLIVYYVFSKTPPGLVYQLLIPAGFIVLFHFLIDWMKIWLSQKIKVKSSAEGLFQLVLFVADQFLHLASIAGICHFFLNIRSLEMIEKSLVLLRLLKGNPPALSTGHILLFLAIMFIVVTTISGHMIKHLLGNLPTHHTSYEGKYALKNKIDDKKMDMSSKELEISEEFTYTLIKKDHYSRGTVIGYIERLLVVVLTIYGAYPAIGFIVTAKSFARFKQLDDREWAEYFLLGTLTSMFLGILYGIVIRFVIGYDK